MTFSMETSIDEIADTILATIHDPVAYNDLCLSSFNEYKTRLNWEVAGKQVKQILEAHYNFSILND